mmetsp:Transcript_7137/g.12826  ORF Transcript_7137/g.12826 Transcript_7137/m.12826 type:complete len:207 (-) Transcript_7137:597-1217(-)
MQSLRQTEHKERKQLQRITSLARRILGRKPRLDAGLLHAELSVRGLFDGSALLLLCLFAGDLVRVKIHDNLGMRVELCVVARCSAKAVDCVEFCAVRQQQLAHFKVSLCARQVQRRAQIVVLEVGICLQTQQLVDSIFISQRRLLNQVHAKQKRRRRCAWIQQVHRHKHSKLPEAAQHAAVPAFQSVVDRRASKPISCVHVGSVEQ